MKFAPLFIIQAIASLLILLLFAPNVVMASTWNFQQSERDKEAGCSFLSQAPDQNQEVLNLQAASSGQRNPALPPQGTAAAPDMRPEGSPASRPAGAAIAAAKQRRAHSYALRVGLLVGAGIAVGTVIALSLGSSSRPH